MQPPAILHPGDPTTLKLRLLKMQSQLQQRVASSNRDSLEFAYSCLRQISDIRGTQFIDIRFECAELCVPYFYASARLAHALEAASLMLELGQRSQRREWIRRGHTYVGAIQAEMGEVASAITEYHHALKLARELDDKRGAAGTLGNLGAAFLYGGLYTEAKRCFHEVLRFCEEAGFEHLAVSAYGNLAQAHLYSGESEAAYQTICRTLHSRLALRTVKDFHSRTIHELTFVRCAVMTGRTSEAAQHVESCRESAQCAGGDQSVVNYKLARGLVACFSGDASAGLAQLEQCLKESVPFGVVARIMALDILAKACNACGRPDHALTYIQEVLASIRAHREDELRALMSLNFEFARRRVFDESDLHALTYSEASLRAAAAELALANAQRDMLERLAVSATLKDDPSGAHGYRVGALSAALAKELGWPGDQCAELDLAARLHDIGKVAMPDSVALSDRAFQPAQRQMMQLHTSVGAELLGNHTGTAVRLAAEVARHHHEWWDGSGYPARLAANRIPISGRIVALADVYDALTHGRRYAPALSRVDTLEHIAALSGRQFDPDLVPIFQSLVRRLMAQHENLDEYLEGPARSSPFFSARKKIEAVMRQSTLPESAALG